VADRSVVNDMHADWSERGVAIAQRPLAMDFGYTFVALDRDGHRLRVFVPEPCKKSGREPPFLRLANSR
jgi:predicted lactoylglutathione lyase